MKQITDCCGTTIDDRVTECQINKSSNIRTATRDVHVMSNDFINRVNFYLN